MWRVKISRSFRLYRFTDKFVKDVILWARRNPGISQVQVLQKTEMSVPLRKLIGRYPKLNQSMLELSQCKNINGVWKAYGFFSKHYKGVLRGKIKKYPQLDESTTNYIKPVFQYFYDSLLDNRFFWEAYDMGHEYKTKQQIRDMLGEDIKVCPYCDAGYIITNLTSNMDHFLPIKDFPFLSLYWQNILISCTICNGSLVKHQKWYLPILHPQLDDIEDILYFTFDHTRKTISLRSRRKVRGMLKTKLRGNNLIKLLKNDDRYRRLWPLVEDEKRRVQNDIRLNYYTTLYNTKNAIVNIKTIFEKGVKLRIDALEDDLGKLPFSKLKLNYCNEYKRVGDEDLLEWLSCESKYRQLN